MASGWNVAGDFAEVVDTLESVVWKRRCGDERTVEAWRFFESTGEASAPELGVRLHDAVWQLPLVEGDDAPAPGDKLIDASGVCWTVWRAEKLRGSTRWRCDARRAVVRRDLVEWIDLEEAIVDTSGPDPVITGWRIVRPSLRGAVTWVRSELDEASLETLDTYQITLTEPVEATGNHRFRTHAGRAFRVTPTVEPSGDGFEWVFEGWLEQG